jgi:hyperosmotically inducible periplasmic protein
MKTHHVTALLALVAGPLAVFASPTDDRKIEQAAKASYNYRAVLDNHVKVKADNGIVTLTGTVQDQDDKALAQDTVENLPGVTGVKNNLSVKSRHPERSDGWIALKIRSRLLVKGNVSAASTTVAVHDGVATLGGTADTLAQKELTAIYASEIDGVKSVKNQILVSENSPTGPTMTEKIDDASITAQVKYALLRHKSTSAVQTKVTTMDSVTVITGVADSDAEKALVTKLAEDVRGVKSVTNNMTVKG